MYVAETIVAETDEQTSKALDSSTLKKKRIDYADFWKYIHRLPHRRRFRQISSQLSIRIQQPRQLYLRKAR